MEAAQADATVGRAKVNKAMGSGVDEDGHAGNGGNGLRYGMAGLKAAMAVPGSTASCFAEHVWASKATVEEVATEHAAVCRLIVDDQAGALRQALGPEATERTYLVVLNAEGIFSVMHGLQWWAEAPGGARNHRGQMVAFKGEVRMGTGVPNLWRFEEPDDQLFWLLTLPLVLLRDTALYYEDEKNDKYYRAMVAPDAGGPGWAPACRRLIPIPVKWVPMFLDYPDSGTVFCRLVDLINLVDGAERDKYTYLSRSIAYACLSTTKEEHPVSTMAARWKRVVMSRAMKMWATSAWTGQPPLDEAKEECPTINATTLPIDDFSSIFGGQAKRTAVTVPNNQARPVSSPPSGGSAGTRPNPPRTGGGMPRSTTGCKSQVGGVPPRGAPRSPTGSSPTMGGITTSPLNRATSMGDIGTINRTIMEAQLAAQVAMLVASNANMIAFHTATVQALAEKMGTRTPSSRWPRRISSKHAVDKQKRTPSQPQGCTCTWMWKGE